jgi:hypothetical protein
MQVVTECTGRVFWLIALMNEPQCQLCVPTMLGSKLLNQICELLPAGSLTLQTSNVPLPLRSPGDVKLSNRQAPIEPIRVFIPYLTDFSNSLESVVQEPGLRGGDPLPLVFPNPSFAKLLNECMPCDNICCLCLMTDWIREVGHRP